MTIGLPPELWGVCMKRSGRIHPVAITIGSKVTHSMKAVSLLEGWSWVENEAVPQVTWGLPALSARKCCRAKTPYLTLTREGTLN